MEHGEIARVPGSGDGAPAATGAARAQAAAVAPVGGTAAGVGAGAPTGGGEQATPGEHGVILRGQRHDADRRALDRERQLTRRELMLLTAHYAARA